jgi:hypothetical protein
MPRQTTRTYSIGTATDDRLCGTCKKRWSANTKPCWHSCELFNRELRCDKDGKPLRCEPCRANEVRP